MADVTFKQIKELIKQMPPEKLEKLRVYLKTLPELKTSDTTPTDELGWPIGFFEKTYGILRNDPITREPEGDYEVRTPIADANKGTWGKDLVAMVKQFKLGEEDQWPTDDPEEWVRQYRRTQTSRRNKGWGAE